MGGVTLLLTMSLLLLFVLTSAVAGCRSVRPAVGKIRHGGVLRRQRGAARPVSHRAGPPGVSAAQEVTRTVKFLLFVSAVRTSERVTICEPDLGRALVGSLRPVSSRKCRVADGMKYLVICFSTQCADQRIDCCHNSDPYGQY